MQECRDWELCDGGCGAFSHPRPRASEKGTGAGWWHSREVTSSPSKWPCGPDQQAVSRWATTSPTTVFKLFAFTTDPLLAIMSADLHGLPGASDQVARRKGRFLDSQQPGALSSTTWLHRGTTMHWWSCTRGCWMRKSGLVLF